MKKLFPEKEKIEYFPDIDILWTTPEMDFIGKHIKKYFQKSHPIFSDTVSNKVNSWCEGKVDEYGWHPTLFEGILLIIAFLYMVARTLVLLLMPSFGLLLLLGLLLHR